jgi:hypothetical protein
MGRLNWAHDLGARKEERAFTFKYEVVHEKIKGTWGKDKKQKRRRCQSFSREERISILKQIGWYISDPPKRKVSTPLVISTNEKEKHKIRTKKDEAALKTLEINYSKKLTPKESLDGYMAGAWRNKELKENVARTNDENPNRNIVCCMCNKTGTLRPRISNGKLLYYFAHGKINGKEIRHHISSNDSALMSYCAKHDKKNLHKA